MKKSTLSTALSYYQLDVHNHERPLVSAMIEDLGAQSEWISVKLSCLILAEGHYLKWDKFSLRALVNKTGESCELVEKTLAWLLDNGVYDRKLFEEEGVLTGVEIQRFFFSVTSRRKNTAQRQKYRLWFPEEASDDDDSDDESTADDEPEASAKPKANKQSTSAKRPSKPRSSAKPKTSVASNCKQLALKSRVEESRVEESKPDCLPTMQDLNYKKNGGSKNGDWVGMSPEEYAALPAEEQARLSRESAARLDNFGEQELAELEALMQQLLANETWLEDARRTLKVSSSQIAFDLREFVDELRARGDGQKRDLAAFRKHFVMWHKGTLQRRIQNINNQITKVTHGTNARFAADREYRAKLKPSALRFD